MRFLFVKTELCWPRSSGHDVHSYHMMKALIDVGHEVALTTIVDTDPQAIDGLALFNRSVFPESSTLNNGSPACQLTWRQERFRSYWGVEHSHIQFVRDKADALDVDAVVVVGMEVLPYLAGVKDRMRIWYAADEWVWHHLSLVKATKPGSWRNIKDAFVLGLYENSFAKVTDRAWVVSQADKRALKIVAGRLRVDVIPNGVNSDYFTPSQETEEENRSCTFWGCLDFAPNVQALQWFCAKVWPLVIRETADARFNIFGFNPKPEVLQLAELQGVSVTPNVPDIRVAVGKQQVVVLPFQSGGGVKNKLLEAASMAKPILCSQRARNGLNNSENVPFRLAKSPKSWASELQTLWANEKMRKTIGEAARSWVIENHTWNAAAENAVTSMTQQRQLVPVV